jgi:hypothetical protein
MTFFFISLLCFENVLFFFLSLFFYRMLRLLHLTNIYASHHRSHQKRERARTCAFDKRKKRDDAWNFILSLSPCLLLYLYVCVSKKSRETFDSSIHIHTYIWNQTKCPLCSIVNVHLCKNKKKRRNSKDIKPMAHLTIVTKRYCAFMYVFGINANNWFHTTMLDRYFR